jgi:hypothetical protein
MTQKHSPLLEEMYAHELEDAAQAEYDKAIASGAEVPVEECELWSPETARRQRGGTYGS